MLVVISPAKSLDYETPVKTRKFTQAAFLHDSQKLIDTLRHYSPDDISGLMSISPALSQLNHDRFNSWTLPFDNANARQALFAFKGDVYIGLDAYSLNSADISFAQNHLRILSGLYGLLRPLDLIRPYRLEMGTSLKTQSSSSLYEFWGNRITESLNHEFEGQKQPVLINLASHEYFRAVKEKQLTADVVSPVFKDYKSGQYKIISFFAKKARGTMTAYIIRNRLRQSEDLLSFDMDGYKYSPKDSAEDTPVFLRKQ